MHVRPLNRRSPLAATLPWRGWPDAPVRYQIDGAPTLHLDPKTREFHAAGDLSELAAYCEHPLNSGEWSAPTSAQVNETRQLPGRPYAELVWLHTWLTGNGHLSNQLDPGGSYWATRRISIKPEFRQHHAMLGKNADAGPPA